MSGKRLVKIIAVGGTIAVLCAVIIISYRIITGHYQKSLSGNQHMPDEHELHRLMQPNSELISKGKQLYLSHCASCHGANGEGDGPRAWRLKPKPRDYRDKEAFKNGTSVATLVETLNSGVAGSAMPSFRVMPIEDRYAIVHFVRTLMPDAEMSLNQITEQKNEMDN